MIDHKGMPCLTDWWALASSTEDKKPTYRIEGLIYHYPQTAVMEWEGLLCFLDERARNETECDDYAFLAQLARVRLALALEGTI